MTYAQQKIIRQPPNDRSTCVIRNDPFIGSENTNASSKNEPACTLKPAGSVVRTHSDIKAGVGPFVRARAIREQKFIRRSLENEAWPGIW